MSASKKALVTGLVIGALALAGCGPAGAGTTEAGKKADTLTQLRTDAKASLETVAQKSSTNHSATITIDGTMMGQPMTGSGQVSFADPLAVQMQMTAAGQAVEIRLIAGTEYVKVPAAQRPQLSGKRWMKIDLAQAANMAGVNLDQLGSQMHNMDPAKQVKAMLKSGKLTVVGEETVDGAKTVHYVSDVSLEQYLDAYANNAAGRAQLKAAFDKLGAATAGNIKSDLWVDEQYQMRKAHTKLGTFMDVSYTYSDFGKQVTVTPPPAAEVYDTAELLKRIKGAKGPGA